ncbi:hypothetical protein NESM_000516800 [Novymonas esmeraldas]|uniref:Uncharacterized protein n=1 Tax=Novymonas esmeraldas TaxID=1808958 RepID=A0AAW0ERS8_9TRYP
MAWEAETQQQRRQWGHVPDSPGPHTAEHGTALSHTCPLAATANTPALLRSQTHHGAAPSRTPPASTSLAAHSAMAAVARLKARYTPPHYSPPPALQRSRLTTERAAGVAGGAPSRRPPEGPASLTQSTPWSRPAVDTAAPASWTESCRTLVALQERQLLCWQQLTETQQLMVHHIQRLREEVQHVHEVLQHRLGNCTTAAEATDSTATDFRKRRRVDSAADHGAAAAQQSAAPPTTRLLGESTASTPAPVHDASAGAEVAKPPTSPLTPCATVGDTGGTAHTLVSTDAADCEADIFLL